MRLGPGTQYADGVADTSLPNNPAEYRGCVCVFRHVCACVSHSIFSEHFEAFQPLLVEQGGGMAWTLAMLRAAGFP